jgi:hypothetical protein
MYTVNYASRRSEIWRWYWRAWKRPAGLWRFHVMFGLVFAFVFAVLPEPRAFRLGYFLTVAVFGTLACVVFLPLWPQLRFKPTVRMLTINAEGLVTAVGSVSGSRSWKEVRSIEDSDGVIVITGNNKNAFVVPERAFANSSERKQFFEAARQWHSAAVA